MRADLSIIQLECPAHALYRQALRYVVRNTSLPSRVRAEAQLQLQQMSNYTRPTQIRNRCTMGGYTRGVFRDFKMTRVGLVFATRLAQKADEMQYNFRLQAMAGNLPGVKRASW